jgi:hypothetical protein
MEITTDNPHPAGVTMEKLVRNSASQIMVIVKKHRRLTPMPHLVALRSNNLKIPSSKDNISRRQKMLNKEFYSD